MFTLTENVSHDQPAVVLSTNMFLGIMKNSSELVPGDIVSLEDLSIFPADMFLCSGDAIVNESMLTGESVPVNKLPVKDAELAKWRDSTDTTLESTKSFLYAGTRVVRLRGAMTADGRTSGPPIALVVRGGVYVDMTGYIIN